MKIDTPNRQMLYGNAMGDNKKYSIYIFALCKLFRSLAIFAVVFYHKCCNDWFGRFKAVYKSAFTRITKVSAKLFKTPCYGKITITKTFGLPEKGICVLNN